MAHRFLGAAFAAAMACVGHAPAALSGGCRDFSDFDRSRPEPITGVVNNGRAVFRWGSDADQISGRWWAWDYIGNDHASAVLKADWPKAGIHRGPDRPLPPLAYDCHMHPILELPWQPDFDAPIVYESGATQNAAVYHSETLAVAPAGAGPSRGGVHLVTEYFTDRGDRRVVRVDFWITQIGGGVLLKALVDSDGVYVGLSRLGSALGRAQIDFLQTNSKKLGVDVQHISAAQLSRRGFDPDWSFPHQRDSSFLFFEFRPPRSRAELFIPGRSSHVRPEYAYLVLLDKEREPITTAPVLILVPDENPDQPIAFDFSGAGR
jgi:hypothetical protein